MLDEPEPAAGGRKERTQSSGKVIWSPKHLELLHAELAPAIAAAPVGYASVQEISDALGSLAARVLSGEADLIPISFTTCSWLPVEAAISALADPDGFVDVADFMIQLAIPSLSEDELRTAHGLLAADEAFPEQAVSDEVLITLPQMEASVEFIRQLLGDFTARRLLSLLAIGRTPLDGARRLLVAFTGGGIAVEPEVPADPKAKNAVVETPPEFAPMTPEELHALFCPGRAASPDMTLEELTTLFAAESVDINLTALPWPIFLAEPRVRRYIARPTLNLSASVSA